MSEVYSVDVPDPHALSRGPSRSRNNSWTNIGNFLTRKEAEIWTVKHIVGYWNQTLLDFFITEHEGDKETNEH